MLSRHSKTSICMSSQRIVATSPEPIGVEVRSPSTERGKWAQAPTLNQELSVNETTCKGKCCFPQWSLTGSVNQISRIGPMPRTTDQQKPNSVVFLQTFCFITFCLGILLIFCLYSLVSIFVFLLWGFVFAF